MEDKLVEMVKENTRNEKYKRNNAMDLKEKLNLSRNWISQYLNEYYNNGIFIKINTRPVVYLDKSELEKQYQCSIEDSLFSSFQALLDALKGKEKKSFDRLIGAQSSLLDLVDKCKSSIAYPPNGLPTILIGPTGSGKSFIVYLMYLYGVENGIIGENAKFIHVNCSEYTNNPELLTANLFGYKKGAFTGADSDNIGLIKAAEGGVLFLDEVHCLKPECQEKLFLFMDNGYYRMLGDNETLYSCQVRIVFATTEDPQKVLLKTLYRRIPITLRVPSIEERGINEKAQLIIHYLKEEAHKLKSKLYITNVAYNTLLNAQYMGNVGEIKNTIQATCMHALYHHKKEDELQIHTLDLPESIISNVAIDSALSIMDRQQLISLQALQQRVHINDSQIFLIKELLDQLLELQNNRIPMSQFIERDMECLERYYHKLLFVDYAGDNIKDSFILNRMKKVVELIGFKYGLTFQENEIQMLSMFVRDVFKRGVESAQFCEAHAQETTDFAKVVEKKYPREYAIAKEMSTSIQASLDIQLHNILIALLTLSIVLYHAQRDTNKHVAIILAHGYATASSIANAANQFLNAYVFDAIDMPLQTSNEEIIHTLNVFLQKRGEYHDLILLVDMGSLEKIYEGMAQNANIAIANNVNTKMAICIGEGLKKEESLQSIFEYSFEQNKSTYHIINKVEKEKVILCSCATGIGTAEKLKDILMDSLPANLPVKILTYDYSTLLENKLEHSFFENYEVICIVGTLNPNINNIKFIPVEELIMYNSFDILTIHFHGFMSDNDMESIHKNILKNFSLSNIIGNLTILNPAKLLEHVADAIDRLQSEMNINFNYNTCFGLYVHICCLIERLVKREGAQEYVKQIEECDIELQYFVQYMKVAFSKVEKYYSVQLPIEEIEFINIYVKNIQG